jgi:hypothetical protein
MPEIENPYAHATVENFRRSPASLRPQFLKMLERELNGAESAQTFPSTTFRRIPFDDRAEEFQWLAQKSARFQGEWIALLGNRLVDKRNPVATRECWRTLYCRPPDRVVRPGLFAERLNVH